MKIRYLLLIILLSLIPGAICVTIGIENNILILIIIGYILMCVYAFSLLLLFSWICLVIFKKIKAQITNLEKNNMKPEKENFIIIKGKEAKIIINIEEFTIKYKKHFLSINEILNIQLLDSSRIIEYNGAVEAIIGGIIDGPAGVVAGACIGEKTNSIEDYKVLLTTSNIFDATVFIPASYENCIKLINTLNLLLQKAKK